MFEFKAVCISISHMEEGDIRVLQVLSSTTNYLTCDSYLEWIHDTPYGCVMEGANKQVISSQADSLIKISRIWADFFPANTSNQPI